MRHLRPSTRLGMWFAEPPAGSTAGDAHGAANPTCRLPAPHTLSDREPARSSSWEIKLVRPCQLRKGTPFSRKGGCSREQGVPRSTFSGAHLLAEHDRKDTSGKRSPGFSLRNRFL